MSPLLELFYFQNFRCTSVPVCMLASISGAPSWVAAILEVPVTSSGKLASGSHNSLLHWCLHDQTGLDMFLVAFFSVDLRNLGGGQYLMGKGHFYTTHHNDVCTVSYWLLQLQSLVFWRSELLSVLGTSYMFLRLTHSRFTDCTAVVNITLV